MNKKIIFGVVAVLILIVLLLNFYREDELSSEGRMVDGLSIEEGFVYDIPIGAAEDILVECDKCDKKSECSFVCISECADKGFNFFAVLPLFGFELENESICPCSCYPLLHVNDLSFVKAVKDKDVSECDKIEIETKGPGKDYCYMDVAILLQDESICENILLNDDVKNECYFGLAIMKKDIGLCSSIIEKESSEWTESLCEEYIDAGKDFHFAVPE